MNKELYGVLVDVKNNIVEPKNILDNLDSYYKELNCSTIDIVERRIGNNHKYFNIICDDEGLLTDNPKISAISSNMQPMLYGNLFIVGDVDENGNLLSLTEKEAKYILKHMTYVFSKRNPVPFPVISNMEY